jgi:NTE family protein
MDKVKIQDLKHSYNVIERVLKIRNASDSVEKFDNCILVIRPQGLRSFSTFSLKDVDSIFDIGYKAATEALKRSNLEKRIPLPGKVP